MTLPEPHSATVTSYLAMAHFDLARHAAWLDAQWAATMDTLELERKMYAPVAELEPEPRRTWLWRVCRLYAGDDPARMLEFALGLGLAGGVALAVAYVLLGAAR